MLPFRGLSLRLSVCLSITFVHCKWHKISTLIRLLTAAPYQIAAEWLEIAQWSQWRAYIGNHHRSFEWCYRGPPTAYPSLKMRVTNALLGQTSRRLLPPGEYDRRYQQGSCVLCRMKPSDVDFCQIITFAVVYIRSVLEK